MRSKAELRRQALSRRDALPPQYRKEASAAIAEAFLKHWGNYERYALYHPMRSEADTLAIIQALTVAGKTVLLPKLVNDTELHWGGCDGLEKSSLGIHEPGQARPERSFDVIAVPCAAFDRGCHRLGYGRGCYDRFLAQAGYKAAVILAFDIQLVETTLPGPHDIAADAVVTEKEIFHKSYKFM